GLENLEDQLLLAEPPEVLNVEIPGDPVEIGDGLFLQLGQVHPVGGGWDALERGGVGLVTFAAGTHSGAPGAASRGRIQLVGCRRRCRLCRFSTGLERLRLQATSSHLALPLSTAFTTGPL